MTLRPTTCDRLVRVRNSSRKPGGKLMPLISARLAAKSSVCRGEAVEYSYKEESQIIKDSPAFSSPRYSRAERTAAPAGRRNQICAATDFIATCNSCTAVFAIERNTMMSKLLVPTRVIEQAI